MAAGTIQIIDGKPAIVEQRAPRLLTAFVLQDGHDQFSAGATVTYRVLWHGGWEGEGADVTGPDGKTYRAHLELYHIGTPTIAAIAEDLNMDEDDVALGIMGVRRAQ